MTSRGDAAGCEAAFIWSTRGKNWGFRFLRTAARPNPLELYEAAFAGIENTREVFRRAADVAALRFSDPEGRRDAAGRVIPHEFVLFAPASDTISSVQEGFELVWPIVADDYARDWEQPQPRVTST